MKMRATLLVAMVAFVAVGGCLGVVTRKDPHMVTLILESGERVPSHIRDVKDSKLFIEALDERQARKYGEVISMKWVKEIQLPDGRRMTVDEYLDYRKEARTGDKTQRLRLEL